MSFLDRLFHHEPSYEEVVAQVTSPDYWLNLTLANATLLELVNTRECVTWAQRAYELGGQGVMGYRAIQDNMRNGLTETLGVWGHAWLDVYSDVAQDYFIADGTAPQFDPSFPYGYYGYLSEATEPLLRAYAFKYGFQSE